MESYSSFSYQQLCHKLLFIGRANGVFVPLATMPTKPDSFMFIRPEQAFSRFPSRLYNLVQALKQAHVLKPTFLGNLFQSKNSKVSNRFIINHISILKVNDFHTLGNNGDNTYKWIGFLLGILSLSTRVLSISL